MNIAVRYYTRSGNTKKIADAIAKSVGSEAKDCAEPVADDTDLLFLGGSVYAGGADQHLKDYIAQLDPSKIKKAAVFGTSALKKEPDKEVEKLLREKGIPVLETGFHCRGSFTVMHRGRPNEKDLQEAADFALAAVKQAKSK